MDDERATYMLHLECFQCPMTATLVHTPTAIVAWQDHMATHPDPLAFGQWAWHVVALPFD
jgi:hypothetical protein